MSRFLTFFLLDHGATSAGKSLRIFCSSAVFVRRKAGIPCDVNKKTAKPVCKAGHCIFCWSNGDVSADNATLCDKDF